MQMDRHPPTRSPARVPCPSCGHDLRGVPATDGLYRCPECGGVVTLEQIVQARLNRARTGWRITVGVLVAVIGILLVMIAT